MSFILLGILSAQGEAPAAGAYDLLETQILSSSASSVEFTGLDTLAAGYQHLQLRMTLRNTTSGTGFDGIQFRLNSDTASNYASHHLRGFSGSVSSEATANDSGISLNYCYPGNGADSGVFGVVVADFLDFASTSKNTTVRSLQGAMTGTPVVAMGSGFWNNTAAVTSIQVWGRERNFLAGCRMSLYGIKGE